MTVYVDDMHLTDMGRLGRMKMCHMLVDSTNELVDMACARGIARDACGTLNGLGHPFVLFAKPLLRVRQSSGYDSKPHLMFSHESAVWIAGQVRNERPCVTSRRLRIKKSLKCIGRRCVLDRGRCQCLKSYVNRLNDLNVRKLKAPNGCRYKNCVEVVLDPESRQLDETPERSKALKRVHASQFGRMLALARTDHKSSDNGEHAAECLCYANPVTSVKRIHVLSCWQTLIGAILAWPNQQHESSKRPNSYGA